MEKCRRQKRPEFTSKNWIYSWLWKSSRIRRQSSRLESFSMNTDIFTSGSTVKILISLKTVFGDSATRRTSFGSWFLVCQRVLPPVFPLQHPWHLQDKTLIILHLPQARLLHQPQLCQATVRLEHEKTWAGQISIQYLCQVNMFSGKNGATRWPSQLKIQNQIKTKTTIYTGATRCVLTYPNDCKNSEKISWMMEFLNAETHTYL